MKQLMRPRLLALLASVLAVLSAATGFAQGAPEPAPAVPAAAATTAPASPAEASPEPAAPIPTAQPVWPPAGDAPPAAGTYPALSPSAGAAVRAPAAPAGHPGAYEPAPAARAGRAYDGPPLLFGQRRMHVGGYGGFGTAYTRMLNRDGAALSFEGALLLGHRLSLGVAGYGFSRTPDGPAAADGRAREFGTGYGGFVARYAIFFSDFPVYASVGVLLGGGAVVLHNEDWEEHEDWDEDRDDGEGDGFFVAQPELSLHANLTRWMRLGLTGGYRVTSGVSRFGLKEGDLNGVVLGGNIQFGWI